MARTGLSSSLQSDGSHGLLYSNEEPKSKLLRLGISDLGRDSTTHTHTHTKKVRRGMVSVHSLVCTWRSKKSVMLPSSVTSSSRKHSSSKSGTNWRSSRTRSRMTSLALMTSPEGSGNGKEAIEEVSCTGGQRHPRIPLSPPLSRYRTADSQGCASRNFGLRSSWGPWDSRCDTPR